MKRKIFVIFIALVICQISIILLSDKVNVEAVSGNIEKDDIYEMMFYPENDPTLTVYSTLSDGYVYKSSTNYSTAWTSSTGTVSDSASTISIGQDKVLIFPIGSKYYIYRGFLFFNTSTLPSNANITNATLSIYKNQDFSYTDFDIVIQNGQPTYPHDPLQSGDYNKSYYSGNGGSINTNNFSNGYNDIAMTNYSWINKEGMTKLCLRSSSDIDGMTPMGREYVTVRSRNYLGISFAPKLTIEYVN